MQENSEKDTGQDRSNWNKSQTEQDVLELARLVGRLLAEKLCRAIEAQKAVDQTTKKQR